MNRRKAERYFWMRSAICRWKLRHGCCGFCSRASSCRSEGGSTIKTNVRIIAATHRDLRILIQQGQFREDLFFRLNVVPVRIPPLRERAEDVGDLVRHFLMQAGKEGLPAQQFSRGALDALMRYRWPGNVRELQNLVRRLAVLQADEVITAAMIELELSGPVQPPGAAGNEGDQHSIGQFMERHLARYFAEFGNGLPPDGLHERILREVEIPLMTAALAGHQWKSIARCGSSWH